MRGMLITLLLLAACGVGLAGEKAFSWTYAPGKGDYIGVTFNAYHLGKYLAECEINRPEVLAEVRDVLSRGEYYRKTVMDQKARSTKVTVNVTPDYSLRIVTWRNETCPECKGTGRRELPVGKYAGNINTALRCRTCLGEGHLKNHTTEKFFVISAEDFSDVEEGRRIMANKAYRDAPRDAERYVEQLVSKDPKARLDACVWLDKNYVREGMQFQDIMPMLRKARYHEANEKKRIMVWQFWAGKDVQGEKKRAFYRIYVNSKTGKITEKGFFAAK